MKIKFFLMAPIVLILNACGGNKQSSGGGAAPPPEQVDINAVHRPEECPSKLNGDFVDRQSKQARRLELSKEPSGRFSLSDDEMSYFVTGEIFPKMNGTRADGYRLYRAVCNQGAVRVTFFHKSNRGELGNIPDGLAIYAQTQEGGFHYVRQTRNQEENLDQIYDRTVFRATPPVRPRPRPHPNRSVTL